jgi:hypothetical protein
MQVFFEQRGARPGVRLRGLRIQIAGAADAHRRHVANRRIEGARLAAGRILGEVDALTSEQGPMQGA